MTEEGAEDVHSHSSGHLQKGDLRKLGGAQLHECRDVEEPEADGIPGIGEDHGDAGQEPGLAPESPSARAVGSEAQQQERRGPAEQQNRAHRNPPRDREPNVPDERQPEPASA